MSKNINIRLPPVYKKQEQLFYWKENNPNAQCLVAPCGVKVGKSLGSAIWLLKENLIYNGLYSVWIAPTYMKAKIGFRYMKYMLPDLKEIRLIESRLEIHLPNGSMIKFLHGKDAETVVEGEAIDRYIVDETGKQDEQLWFSLFTTTSQTGGIGIITGTPRGFTWYYDLYKKAVNGDPFFAYITLQTKDSPYVKDHILKAAKKLLPPNLYKQYYLGLFVSASSVFGDIEKLFYESTIDHDCVFWIHPDPLMREKETITGWDIAKHVDYSVFYTVDLDGNLLGYYRFNKVPYTNQVKRLKKYFEKYFPKSDKMLRYDMTGIGSAIGDMLVEEDLDVAATGVIFSQKSKQEMVTIMTMALDSGWHKCPKINRISHELTAFQVHVSKSGLFSYSAPSGDHDDVVCAMMLAISGAYEMRDYADNVSIDEQLDKVVNENGDIDMSAAAAIFNNTDNEMDDNDDLIDPDDINDIYDFD